MSLSVHHYTTSVGAWTAEWSSTASALSCVHRSSTVPPASENTRSDDESVAGIARMQRTTAESFGHTAELSRQKAKMSSEVSLLAM